MADCECLTTCPFFNDQLAVMPATANLYKARFCKDTFEGCARYLVFKELGRSAVPLDLYPHEIERARQLLAGKK